MTTTAQKIAEVIASILFVMFILIMAAISTVGLGFVAKVFWILLVFGWRTIGYS